MAVDELVDQANKVKQARHRDGGVEVIIHRLEEAVPQAADLGGDGIVDLRHRCRARLPVTAGQAVERRASQPFIAGKEPLKGLQSPGRLGQRLFAKVNRAAIVRREQQQPDRLGAVPGQQLLERLSPGRFRDFGGCLGCRVIPAVPGPTPDLAGRTGSLHQAVVHPVAGHRTAVQ